MANSLRIATQHDARPAASKTRSVRRTGSSTNARETYVRANSKLFVKGYVDCEPFISDPDQLVPWEDVEFVQLFTTEEQACPICLAPPVAAKITRCGHVYCWPCILHHLASSIEKTWNYCPLCDDYVVGKDLRSVVFKTGVRAQVGKMHKFRLVERPRTSAAVVPRAAYTQLTTASNAISFTGDQSLFRIGRITRQGVLGEIVAKEDRELRNGEHGIDDSFVIAAIHANNARAADLLNKASKVSLDAPSPPSTPGRSSPDRLRTSPPVCLLYYRQTIILPPLLRFHHRLSSFQRH